MTRRTSLLALTLVGALLLTALFIRSVAATGMRTADPTTGPAFAEPVGQGAGLEGAVSTSSCVDGEQESGAKYRICTPTPPTVTWNGDLVVYAHGYVAYNRPVEIPEDQMSLPGSERSVDQMVTDMGYAFATTSYYTNGLAVLPAIGDLLDLVHVFTTTQGVTPTHVYLVGVSEGGLITTLSVEQHPEVYDGGLAMCGPYGDFHHQINHFGDFRVVFDYFFPDLMPGQPLSIPLELQEQWDHVFTTTIRPAVTDPANAARVDQLLEVTDVSPYHALPPTSTESIQSLLWYNVFATNDGVRKLGGQPFDNQDPYRTYSGSNDDQALNDPQTGVERISGDPVARDEIEAHYQTTGELSVPLVTLHTTGDPVVPYWHSTHYRLKTMRADNLALHQPFTIDRPGHCAFAAIEVIGAFNYLVEMVEDPPAYRPVERLFLPTVTRMP